MAHTFEVGGGSDDLVYLFGEEFSGGWKLFKFTTPGGEVIEAKIEYDVGGWDVTLPKSGGSPVFYREDDKDEWEVINDD